MEEEDWKFLEEQVDSYCRHFSRDRKRYGRGFIKLVPISRRVWG